SLAARPSRRRSARTVSVASHKRSPARSGEPFDAGVDTGHAHNTPGELGRHTPGELGRYATRHHQHNSLPGPGARQPPAPFPGPSGQPTVVFSTSDAPRVHSRRTSALIDSRAMRLRLWLGTANSRIDFDTPKPVASRTFSKFRSSPNPPKRNLSLDATSVTQIA